MDYILKIYLDIGMYSTNTNSEKTSGEALLKALSIANGNIETLTSSLEYLVRNGANARAITSFINAIEQTDIRQETLIDIILSSLKYLVMHENASGTIKYLEKILKEENWRNALVDSITSQAEFIRYLKYKQLRDIITTYCRDNEHVQRLAGSALVSDIRVDYEVLMTLCDLRGEKGQNFLKPQLLKPSDIGDYLNQLKLSPEYFLPDVANSAINNCLAYKPQNEAASWLSAFLSEILDYYGRPALSWMLEEIPIRHATPEFWERALFVLYDRSTQYQLESLELTSEQHKWMHRCKMERIKNELKREYERFVYNYPNRGTIQIQHPMTWFADFNSDFPGHMYRPIWSWLMSEAAEAAIYSWFHQACNDLVDDYASPEDSITGALCAYLKSHATAYKELLDIAWRIGHPKERLQFNIDYVDCRRGRDVGGADLALVLSANAKGMYACSSFAAFQCKKLKGLSLSFSDKELIQKKQIQEFTHSSYYMLYPCEFAGSDARGPIVISARTMDGMLKASNTKSVDRHVLLSTGRGLEEYFIADLLPGWSGDVRWETPEVIREVVEAALHPVHLLNMTVRIIPGDENDVRNT